MIYVLLFYFDFFIPLIFSIFLLFISLCELDDTPTKISGNLPQFDLPIPKYNIFFFFSIPLNTFGLNYLLCDGDTLIY